MNQFRGEEKQAFYVVKPLNNNVIFAESDGGTQWVLVGKGLGFGRKKGDPVPAGQIEKKFVLSDHAEREQYSALLDTIDRELAGACAEAIGFICEKSGETLHEHIHVALTDHIAFAVKRLQQGMEIVNPFLIEIRTLYPQEYQWAEEAAKLIGERVGIAIPEGEVGFIALHIHSARTKQSVSRVLRSSNLIKELIETIERRLELTIDRHSIDYARLVTHLRFAMERSEKRPVEDHVLEDVLQKRFPLCYNIADEICRQMETALGCKVPQGERAYLTLHIRRVWANSKAKKTAGLSEKET
ncbi:ptsGHI operon transcription antiterminator GlcT [Bacillaceae bacterium]